METAGIHTYGASRMWPATPVSGSIITGITFGDNPHNYYVEIIIKVSCHREIL